MRGSIAYAGQSIDFSARFSRRRTLAISVNPNGSVEIVAPEGTAQEVIEERLQRRATWVLRQREYFEQFRPRTPPRRYVGGETHLYLGRQYRLKIEEGAEDCIRLWGGYFLVTLAGGPTPRRAAELMGAWYQTRAKAKLGERFAVVTERFARMLPDEPTLAIRRMYRRWGSYSATGRITLNTDLVRAPLPCIDYVVVHELAHGRYPNHSRAFFALLSQMMPDWERRKLILERMLS